MHKTRPAFLCIFHKVDFYLLTAGKKCAIIQTENKKQITTAGKVVKTEKRKTP